MPWLPDTNVWIQILKEPGGVLERAVLEHPPDQIQLCSVVKAELWHGAHKYGRVERRLTALRKLFDSFTSVPFDDDAAWHYGEIRHNLEIQGCVIGPNDLKIASICLANNLTLVTANTREFSRVGRLVIEDWSA